MPTIMDLIAAMLNVKKITLPNLIFCSAALGAAFTASPLLAAPLTTKDVQKIVHDYIQAHPQEIMATLQRMQQEKALQQQRDASANIKSHQDELLHSPGDPVVGNPKGDVTLVEFFDYNCGYCKKSAPVVAKLISEDPNLRIVFKEYPILSPESQTAARTAAAVYKVDSSKYLSFHMELMKQNGPKTAEALLDMAKNLGVDPEGLKVATGDGSADKVINSNLLLAQSIGLQGTPAFIIGDELIPGAVDAATLQAKIAALRAKK